MLTLGRERFVTYISQQPFQEESSPAIHLSMFNLPITNPAKLTKFIVRLNV